MSEEVTLEAAAHWHVRQNADDMDWSAFETWLNADPRHRDAFDDIALLDADIGHHGATLARLLPAGDAEPIGSTRGGWRRGLLGGGTVAAAAAVALVVATQSRAPVDMPPPAALYQAGTAPRDLQIADARVMLAPGSRMEADGPDRTRMTLSGRAVFTVAHDPVRTLLVRAEGYEIRDVGTRFEIVAGNGIVRVSVAEGTVEIRPAGSGAAIQVTAGHTATGLAHGRMVTGAAARSELGGWRNGPLVYDAMPLGLVAADVARASGRPVVADPDVATRPFSGVLAPAPGDAMGRTLATLAGLEARRQGDTIHLGTRIRR